MIESSKHEALAERWDISHIALAVPDLEDAMRLYGAAMGLEWSALQDPGEMEVVAPMYGSGAVRIEAPREVWSLNSPALELLGIPGAPVGTPGARLWGVRGGQHRVHHICFWVDDLVAASAQLTAEGFPLEVTMPPGETVRGFAYHVNEGGTRVELMRAEDKTAIDNWLRTGELDLSW
jgi:catechol 2,3-dioxygenase-like lactoylglutathione lyase family enzyme